MRTTDERMAELSRRIKNVKRDRARRCGRILALGSVTACLVLIVAVSFAMPGMTEHLSGEQYAHTGSAASMFAGNAALGFIVIGVLAFVLGACVTVLCYRLRRRDWEHGYDRDS